jgi:hypothetical protein
LRAVSVAEKVHAKGIWHHSIGYACTLACILSTTKFTTIPYTNCLPSFHSKTLCALSKISNSSIM